MVSEVSEGSLLVFLTSEPIFNDLELPKDSQEKIGEIFVEQFNDYSLVLKRSN